jgi:hypothetical protein|tara:strand:- start:676 stop:900 length:225 start_codon:yes stop_codon:yes gene_type:complete
LQVAALELIIDLMVQVQGIMLLEAVVLVVYMLRREQLSLRALILFLLVVVGQIKHLIQFHHQMALVPMEIPPLH